MADAIFQGMVQAPNTSLMLEAFLQLPETRPASEFIDGQIVCFYVPNPQISIHEDPESVLPVPNFASEFGLTGS